MTTNLRVGRSNRSGRASLFNYLDTTSSVIVGNLRCQTPTRHPPCINSLPLGAEPPSPHRYGLGSGRGLTDGDGLSCAGALAPAPCTAPGEGSGGGPRQSGADILLDVPQKCCEFFGSFVPTDETTQSSIPTRPIGYRPSCRRSGRRALKQEIPRRSATTAGTRLTASPPDG